MKRIISLAVLLAMVFCLGVPAFAANVATNGGTDNSPVKGTYVAGTESAIIYSVDITWGALEFTYTDASEGTWNPGKHVYDGAKAAAWTVDKTDGDKITVTNHSNTAINATLSYASKTEFSAVTGAFDKSVLNLASAVETEITAAPSDSAKLTLNGALASTTTSQTQIGTVTISIAKA